MPQSLSKILLHCVFSTKNRARLILDELQPDLHAYISGICRSLGSNAYRVGGTSDHVHIACSLSRTIAACKLMEEIKKSSSKWMKEKSPRCSSFTWQGGYAVFSLGQSQLSVLTRYIDNQKEHHARVSYKEEVLELLKKYEIEFDERFLWD